ncbi:MAG TPA: chorismate-binding protein, partial [bacterium]|nr:chorismate-binding protein [bacterium]
MDVFIRFANRPRCFAGPEQILQCHEPGELPAAFAAMERALARGRHLAGFLAYEAGYAFEPCLRALCPQRDYPLLQFGIYGPPRQTMPVPRPDNPFIARSFSFLLDRPAYNQRITAIRRHIARGDVYQVTFCNKLRFNWQGDPVHALHDLHARQPVPYAAYVRDDSQTIVSLSPERFLVKQGTRLLTEPMKGTWPRGETRAADRAARQSFARDA